MHHLCNFVQQVAVCLMQGDVVRAPMSNELLKSLEALCCYASRLKSQSSKP